jgi:hypothetical protein
MGEQEMNTAKCSSCGAAIIWAKTGRENLMPIDAEPVHDGNVHIRDDGVAVVLNAEERSRHVGPLRKSHFATCINAARHRKAKK